LGPNLGPTSYRVEPRVSSHNL